MSPETHSNKLCVSPEENCMRPPNIVMYPPHCQHLIKEIFNCYCDQSTHFCYWVHSKNTHPYISTKAFESKNCLDLFIIYACLSLMVCSPGVTRSMVSVWVRVRAGQEDNPPHVPGVRTSDYPRSGLIRKQKWNSLTNQIKAEIEIWARRKK